MHGGRERQIERQITELKTLIPRLIESRENLSVIDERIELYVLGIDVPLQLVKERRRQKRQVRRLERRIRELDFQPIKPSLQSMFLVPRVGRIIAGEPERLQIWQGHPVRVPRDVLCEQEGLCALKVWGDSMVDALVREGDWVIMRYQQCADDGDMVAVWLPDEETDSNKATVKYFYCHREPNRIRLQPANPVMEAMYFDDPDSVRVQGKVVMIIRILPEHNAWLYIPLSGRSPGLIIWDEEL